MEDFNAFAAFQAESEAPNYQIPDQRGSKRPLTEDQRKAKNVKDKERRLQHRLEFERLQNVEYQFKEILPRLEELQTEAVNRANIINELTEENGMLKNMESVLHKRIGELEKALQTAASASRTKYLTRKKNQMMWSTTAVRPRGHVQLLPDLCISGAPVVQTQFVASRPAPPEEIVLDKETVTNHFTMKVPFLFVASKTAEVSCIRLRGKCWACPEGGLLHYSFQWTPHQSNQESWENLGWSDTMDDVGLIQSPATPHCFARSGGAGAHQSNFPIKFLLWNSVGALNAYRQSVVMELINRLQPAVLVLTETRLSRARAEEIIDKFPFDTHRVTPNLGFVGGMWLLWCSEVVEVELLSFTEQEIHALIKVPQTNQNYFPRGFFTDINFDSLEDQSPSSIDTVPSPNEQVVNSEPVTEGQGIAPPRIGSIRYTDDLVEKFTKKLDAMEKNQVKFSDFKGLKEELEIIGTENYLPPPLAPIDERIKTVFGDITSNSPLSACIVRDCYILLCAVIKEMDEMELDQVNEEKMLFWRDAINSGLFIGLRGNFAMDHLKNIARAYYGLKAWNDGCSDKKDMEMIEQRMSELKIELLSLEEKHAKIMEEQNSEVRKQCINVAEQFWGRPLSTYLFPP
ncbi:hypothetical protein CCACVL1_13396 [Corchorus capsularis]|uniref:Uncharacterized protein n=1 Tax=Corchorus capsularis TaxID=210143 RepID=A0A1R3IB37_COCAP|nr:hypothetical protein CCACVL1_13396 [Corchorus capsularis]